MAYELACHSRLNGWAESKVIEERDIRGLYKGLVGEVIDEGGKVLLGI